MESHLGSILNESILPAQAVADGRWLVIEDVNLAPPDVLAALIPLLERRQLQLPQRARAMHAAPGFQLIATVTSAPGAPTLQPLEDPCTIVPSGLMRS